MLRLVKVEDEYAFIIKEWEKVTPESLKEALKELRKHDIGERQLEVVMKDRIITLAANIDGDILVLTRRLTRKTIRKLLEEIKGR